MTQILHLTRGEKGLVLAYAAIMAVSAGVTILVMSGVEGENAIPPEPTFYDNWVIIAGGLGAGFALYLTRNWMGGLGPLGALRALVGTVALAFLGAVIAGTLILPVYGTVVAPAMLVTTFITLPWLAIAWFMVALVAHFLMAIRTEEQTLGFEARSSAVSQLSRLSRVNLYDNTRRY